MKFLKTIGYYLIIAFQHMLAVFPLEYHKVFMISHYGKGYGDNCKYIAEALYAEDPSYKIVWPVRKNVDISNFPATIKVVPYYSLSFFYHLATAGIRISNARLPWFLIKRKKQYYIQCWHGSNAIKMVERDVEDILAKRYVKSAKHDALNTDLMISNSEYWEKIIRNAFWYDGEIMRCGTPRLKALFEDRERNRLRFLSNYDLPHNARLLLYAPTFRADFSLDQFSVDMLKAKKCCEEQFGGNWVAAIRLHPNMVGKSDDFSVDENVIDLTNYPDMYEIMAATDIMITDYSGIMFEAGFAGIKVVLFANDLVEYEKNDRGFYFDIRKLPYPLAETEEQLYEILENWDEKKYQDDNRKFGKILGIAEDGKGAEAVAKRIIAHNKL